MVRKLISGLLIGSFFLWAFQGSGQEWTATKRVALDQSPVSWSVDHEGNAYLGFEDGSLLKYDREGNEETVYSLPNQSAITSVEAQNNRKLFLFYRDIQQITLLDRFSAVPKHYLLEDYEVYFATSSCPAPDGSIWVTENDPRRLKKLDLLRKVTIHEVQYTLGDSIRVMRPYQHLLLIADENGLFVFDPYGNMLNSMRTRGVGYLQVWKDELIVSTHGELLRLNFHDFSVIERRGLPEANAKAVLKLTGGYVIVGDNTLTWYEAGH